MEAALVFTDKRPRTAAATFDLGGVNTSKGLAEFLHSIKWVVTVDRSKTSCVSIGEVWFVKLWAALISRLLDGGHSL